MKNKIIFRIILSPFILIWGLFFTAATWLFPMWFIAGISFVGVISQPLIYLLRLSGSEIEYIDPFYQFKWTTSIWLSHLAFFLLTFWLPIYILYLYIWTGEVFNPN